MIRKVFGGGDVRSNRPYQNIGLYAYWLAGLSAYP
jgi:hypothetical protein